MRQVSYTGTIYADDRDVSLMKVKQLAEIFSYVPQKKEIVEDLRVEDCMVSGFARTISPFSIPTKQHYQKAQNLLDKWNLSHIKENYYRK